MREIEGEKVSTCIDDEGQGDGDEKDGQVLSKEALEVSGEGAEGETRC